MRQSTLTKWLSDDPKWDDIRRKWGSPKIVMRRGYDDYLYECAICGAEFWGSVCDPCRWCHQRWLANREGERKRLLFPEWLGWGDRYWSQDETDQRIWANTRGYARGFEGQWQRDLFNAIGDVITVREAAQALKRHELWLTHMGKSGNS